MKISILKGMVVTRVTYKARCITKHYLYHYSHGNQQLYIGICSKVI